MIRVFFLLILCSFEKQFVFGQDIQFALPLHGIQGKDFWIDYYVDHDSSTGIRDAYCGTKTYNGHTGTDFLIRNFKTMDSGVYVYAMAKGIVFDTKDGNYDREKKWVKGKQDNYIGIIHGGQYFVYYRHLMKNSLLVRIGDTVKAGQPIAKVGSSGYSCYPHVHIGIRDKYRNIIDPFSGSCQNRTASLWITTPAYDTAMYAIDCGFVPYLPQFDTLLESFEVSDTFSAGRDKLVCFWVQMHGLRSGCKIRTEWFNPKGKLWYTYRQSWRNNWWYDYNWNYVWMPHKAGAWKVKYYVNDKLIIERNFYIMNE